MALDLIQLQNVLDNANRADAFKADVKRAFRKVSSSLVNLQDAIQEAELLLRDGYTPVGKVRKAQSPREATEFDAYAPYGRKKDGTPKIKPGPSK